MSGNSKSALDIRTRADSLPASLPDQLREPELSAFRIFHARIAQAQERLQQVQEAWLAFAPVIASRYGLMDDDKIDAEGRIHRTSVSEERE